jgi:VanZ family protein
MSMSEWLRDVKLRVRILWALWFLYVSAWSAALLTPHPVKAAEAVFSNHTHRFWAAKSLHVAAYFVLTVLTTQLSAPRRLRWLLLAVPSLHALGTEGLQNFVPTRTGSWWDVGLDHIGIGLGFAVLGVWYLQHASSSKNLRAASVDASKSREGIGGKRVRSASKEGPC